jgi:hypothetical protein
MRILNDQATIPLRLPRSSRQTNTLRSFHMDRRLSREMKRSRINRQAERMLVAEKTAMTEPYDAYIFSNSVGSGCSVAAMHLSDQKFDVVFMASREMGEAQET